MSSYQLYGKRVIITGASGGIGSALAKALVETRNCRVLALSRNTGKLANMACQLGDRFIYRHFDVNDSEEREYIASHVKAADVLINNAGVLPGFVRADRLTEDEVKRETDTNFTAAVMNVNSFLPALRRSAAPAVINISSADALCPVAGTAVYSASKAALGIYTETFGDENPGIYAAAVYPGFVKTGLFGDDAFGKQADFVWKFAMTPQKAALEIIRGIEKRKSRIIVGADAYCMKLSRTLLGRAAPKVFAGVLKMADLDSFSEVF